MATIIIGSGIIGLSTAYYLSRSPSATSPSSIHLLESSPTLFASASGYAGGFLAADWFSPTVAPLGRLSFDLHRTLAETHNGTERWGYARSTSTSWMASENYTKRGDDWLRSGGSRGDLVKGDGEAGKEKVLKGTAPRWLVQKEGGRLEVIAEDTSTAQVDPERLCRWLLGECEARGVRLHQPARAVRVNRGEGGKIESVTVEQNGQREVIACARILITAGAWTPRVFKELFPQSKISIPISSMAGHSLVLRSPRWMAGDSSAGCHSVFSTDEDGFCPEMFSRPGGEIYLAGLNDAKLPLPDVVTERRIDTECIEVLKRTARRLLGEEVPVGGESGGQGMGGLQVVREGLCWRPVTEWGAPILGRIDDGSLGDGLRSAPGGGVWTAVGHGPWGISQSLGTGKVMAEMLEGMPTSCDVSGLALTQNVKAKL